MDCEGLGSKQPFPSDLSEIRHRMGGELGLGVKYELELWLEFLKTVSYVMLFFNS